MLSTALTAKTRAPIPCLCQSLAYQMEHLLIWQTANHNSVSKLRSLVANFNITQLFQFVRGPETRYIAAHIPVKRTYLKQSVRSRARQEYLHCETAKPSLIMQHCEWNRSLNVFPPYNSSSFYIDDILSSGSQRPQPSICTSTMCEVPKPPCLSPAFHLPPPRTYTNLSSPFTPYHSPRSFGFHAPSIPSVYEAYNDHSKWE